MNCKQCGKLLLFDTEELNGLCIGCGSVYNELKRDTTPTVTPMPPKPDDAMSVASDAPIKPKRTVKRKNLTRDQWIERAKEAEAMVRELENELSSMKSKSSSWEKLMQRFYGHR